tara:strand:- start:1503 stop:1790 length:288 start_codon:yes stop_codon:yes gene_type:complete
MQFFESTKEEKILSDLGRSMMDFSENAHMAGLKDDVIRVYNEMSHVGHMLTAYGAPFGTTIKSFTAADLKLINDFKTQGGEAAIKLNGKDLQLSA